jgi:alkanesulfonate monooxygenase SsuD/methylene tetrahydromethanopterin reductase-like flavin-dependent oxidoreductase (luciferase family)
MRRTPNAGIYGVPFAVGTPDDVLQALSIYRDEPLDQLALQFQAPGMKAEHVERSMRSFARHVMPEIARWGGKPASA